MSSRTVDFVIDFATALYKETNADLILKDVLQNAFYLRVLRTAFKATRFFQNRKVFRKCGSLGKNLNKILIESKGPSSKTKRFCWPKSGITYLLY